MIVVICVLSYLVIGFIASGIEVRRGQILHDEDGWLFAVAFLWPLIYGLYLFFIVLEGLAYVTTKYANFMINLWSKK